MRLSTKHVLITYTDSLCEVGVAVKADCVAYVPWAVTIETLPTITTVTTLTMLNIITILTITSLTELRVNQRNLACVSVCEWVCGVCVGGTIATCTWR